MQTVKPVGGNQFSGVDWGQNILGMHNRKTVLSLHCITAANLRIWVNQGWNSRTQVTQVWWTGGISVGWKGNLQCQHLLSAVLNI